MDLSEEVADFLALYRIEAPMDQAVQLAGVLRLAGAEIGAALSKLGRPEQLEPHLDELRRLEEAIDACEHVAHVLEGIVLKET